jgi:hypothetical protein
MSEAKYDPIKVLLDHNEDGKPYPEWMIHDVVEALAARIKEIERQSLERDKHIIQKLQREIRRYFGSKPSTMKGGEDTGRQRMDSSTGDDNAASVTSGSSSEVEGDGPDEDLK